MHTIQMKPFKLWVAINLLTTFLLLHGCATTTPTQSPPIIEDNNTTTPNTDTTTSNSSGSDTSSSGTTDSNAGADCGSDHVVERGETLFGIATKCGFNYQDVARWNNIAAPYALNPGQKLTLVGTSASETSSENNTSSGQTTDNSNTDGTYHTVVSGDSLFKISKQYSCTVAQLKTWNNLSSDALSIGQRLRVSTTGQAATGNSTTSSTTTDDGTYHTVVSGDSLFKISKQYDCTVAQLKTWNNLSSDALSIGQRLRVSAAK